MLEDILRKLLGLEAPSQDLPPIRDTNAPIRAMLAPGDPRIADYPPPPRTPYEQWQSLPKPKGGVADPYRSQQPAAMDNPMWLRMNNQPEGKIWSDTPAYNTEGFTSELQRRKEMMQGRQDEWDAARENTALKAQAFLNRLQQSSGPMAPGQKEQVLDMILKRMYDPFNDMGYDPRTGRPKPPMIRM